MVSAGACASAEPGAFTNKHYADFLASLNLSILMKRGKFVPLYFTYKGGNMYYVKRLVLLRRFLGIMRMVKSRKRVFYSSYIQGRKKSPILISPRWLSVLHDLLGNWLKLCFGD